MKNGLLLLLLCGLLLVGACRKPGDGKTHPDPRLLEHFNFKPGTYWIYYDSVSNTEDSLYVTRNDILSSSYSESVTITINSRIIYNGHFSLTGKYFQLNYIYIQGFPFFSYPLATGIVDGYASVVDVSSSTLVVGQRYDSLIIVQYNTVGHPTPFPEQNSFYYIKEDVGLVKMQIDTIGSVSKTAYNFNLLRCKIVK